MKNHILNKLETVNKSKKSYKELFLLENLIFWIETLKEKKEGVNAIFVRPFNQKNSIPQNLTGEKFYLKNSFHGYGGKSYKCIQKGEKVYVFWIDQLSKSLWGEVFTFNNNKNNVKYLLSNDGPKKLTKDIEGNFDGCFCLIKKTKLFGLIEMNAKDYLFSVDINGINQELRILKKFKNFAGDLSSNSSANLLSWIEWGAPNMPWEKNDLFFGFIDSFGDIKKIRRFFNKSINENKNVSFFQPHWISDEMLVCSEDSSCWWNLLFINVREFEDIIFKRIKKKFYEYGSPQWVAGITFFSGSTKNLFCLAKNKNKWILEQYKDLKIIQKIDLPFCSISELSVFGKKLLLKGCGLNFQESLLELDFQEKISSTLCSEMFFDCIKDFSKPESFWFKGFDNKLTHSFIYKPIRERFIKPPLLVRAHSGPTASFDGSYNSEVQYWTSKGFLVAEVNYGGSSGFGRKYRERLNCKWGIADSYDCKSLVIELLKLDLVDSNKISILGNSAGGFTALNSLSDGDIFKAAICKYPVIDLKDMHFKTHRFERDYLNSLIGNYEKCPDDYINRSPINKIFKINKPILLFHGKKDLVISYKQTVRIKEKIIKNNKYSDVILFEDEGHGFKNLANKKKVMEKTEEFLKRTFNL